MLTMSPTDTLDKVFCRSGFNLSSSEYIEPDTSTRTWKCRADTTFVVFVALITFIYYWFLWYKDKKNYLNLQIFLQIYFWLNSNGNGANNAILASVASFVSDNIAT